LLTVAPERVPAESIRELARRGVIVSAGHTAATYAEARAALDAGVRGFTHLYNAMSPLASREPGVVGAALDDRASWCGIVVDGFHVHPASLRVALAAKPRGKLFLVTDAMPPVGGSSDTYTLGGVPVTCRNGRCETADGVLGGSALDMMSAVRNAVAMLGVDPAEAVRMASAYPADFLGLASHGRIAAGARAALVIADRELRVREVVG
jgi:N-acetylglucosamine-6-phosphate deacetylase